MYLCACAYVCVCDSRERECVCDNEGESMCVSVCVHVCMHACVCVGRVSVLDGKGERGVTTICRQMDGCCKGNILLCCQHSVEICLTWLALVLTVDSSTLTLTSCILCSPCLTTLGQHRAVQTLAADLLSFKLE